MNGINVSSVDFGIMSKERKLQLSNGEVLVEGSPTKHMEDKIKLDFPEDGLFSEKIFGRSRDSRHEVMDGKFSDSLPKRARTFGHMVLSVPYVVPYLYVNNGSKINLILGVDGSKMMKEIIEWRAALVRVKKGTPLYDHFTFNRPKGTITTEVQKIEISSAYMLNHAVEVPNPKKPGETMLDGAYEYFSVPLQLLKDEASGKVSTENKEYSSLSAIASKETGAYVFLGAYAVLHLLSQINLNDEIIFSRMKMPSLRKKIEEAGSESERKRVSDNYKKTSERYQILLNFKKRNFNLEDIASNIFLVQPAGLRDVSLRVDSNGLTTPIVPKVNETYKTLIQVSNKLKKFGKSITPEEIMEYGPEELDWSRDIPTQDIFIRDAKQIQECINEIIIKSIAGKIGKKKGRFRQAVLSKRLDYSGIGVITPDPQLELDQIGISIHILKKWMEGILEDTSSDKVPKAEILAFLRNYNTLMVDSVHINKEGDNQYSYKEGNIDVQFVEMGERESNKLLITKQFNSILSEFRLLATRFPSLHKFNTLGYEIVVTYDNTTRLHPLVCKHYNADFDGDQMALKLIQTPDAVREVDRVMFPSRNLLNTSGDPLISPTQDAVLGSYYMTLDKSSPEDKVMTFHDYDDMYRAYQMGRVGLNKRVIVGTEPYYRSTYKDQFRRYLETKECQKDIELHSGLPYSELEHEDYEPFLVEEVGTYKTIKPEQNDVKYVESTVGRFIFNSCMPQDLGFVDREVDPYGIEIDGVLEKFNSIGLTSKNLDEIISKIIRDKPIPEVKYIVDMVKHKGYKYATLSGMSMSLQDIYTHPDKKEMVLKSMRVVEQVDKEEKEGKITKKQAYDKRIAEWTKTNDDLANKTMEFLPDDNPVKMMSVSGSRGSKTQITQLMGMRGLMSDTSSNIIETPVTASFIEGMTMTEYFTASYGTRKGIFDRSNRTKETGESTRTSVYGAEKMVVSDGDCGDTEGILMGPLVDDEGSTLKGTMERIRGKFLLQDLLDESGNVVIRKGMPVLDVYKDLEDMYKDNPIRVRSPISCKHRLGTCAKCFGYNYGSNRFSKIGDAVGVLAAQTIGEPGTQLTMRTFHTGGVAKGDITQGFTAVRNLLEKVNKYPPKLESAIQSATDVDDDSFNRIQQEVVNKLDNLIHESGEEVIVKHDITFKDYGVLNANYYIKMMKTLKDYLQISYHSQGVDILDAHYEVIARVMGSNLKVEDAGDSIFIMGQIIEWSDLEATNMTMVGKGLRPVLATPVLTSLKQLAMGPRNPFTAMTFQNINKVLTTALSSQGRDDLTNPMSSIAVSNILASGEGNRRYMHKKKSRYENIISNRELMDELGVPMYEEEADITIEKETQLDMTWEKEEITPIENVIDYHEEEEKQEVDLDWDLDLLDKLNDQNLEEDDENEDEEDGMEEEYGEVEENPTNLSWD